MVRRLRGSEGGHLSCCSVCDTSSSRVVNKNSAEGQIEPTHCLLKGYLAVDQLAIVLASERLCSKSQKLGTQQLFKPLEVFIS